MNSERFGALRIRRRALLISICSFRCAALVNADGSVSMVYPAATDALWENMTSTTSLGGSTLTSLKPARLSELVNASQLNKIRCRGGSSPRHALMYISYPTL